MEFKYDGGGLAKGGIVSLFFSDGKKDGEGRVDIRDNPHPRHQMLRELQITFS